MNEMLLRQIERRLAKIERMIMRLNSEGNVLTVAQAAERLGLSPWTIRRAIKDKSLPATRPAGSRKYHINTDDLLKWDRNRTMPPGKRLAMRVASK